MKRVLIVDDARELGRLLQTVFLTLDPTMTIHVVPSAEEALLISTRNPLDLLVSDIRLPGMSGYELVTKIRARHPQLKVLLITGMTESSVDEQVQALKVDGFFRKPLEMNRFLTATRRCLGIAPDAPLTPLSGMPVDTAPQDNAQAGGGVQAVPETGAPEAPRANLSEIVVGLRQRVGAAAVLVLDERGHIIAQAGDAPNLPLQEQWAAPVMAALSAAEKVSRLVGEGVLQHVMAFHGKEYHLILAPAGVYALVVLVHPGRSAVRMAVAVEEALDAQQPLRAVLPTIEPKMPGSVEAEMDLKDILPATGPLPPLDPHLVQTAAEPEPEKISLIDFEVLLAESEAHLKDSDVDDFWEKATEQGQPTTAVNPDALSYDQARQLGLAPEDQTP